MSIPFEQHPLYSYALVFVVAFGLVSMAVLFFITAPYGRHQREGWGPVIPAKLAWILMEAPSPISFAIVYAMSPNAVRPLSLLALGLYMVHYVYRSFIFPFRMRGSAKTKPLLVALLAVVFNSCNGAINAYAVTELSPHLELGWVADPRFLLGLVLFVAGYAINHQSDAILRNLRAPGENGYKIPHGGLYGWVSSPNYFGEVVEWLGWAILTWTSAGFAFAFFTFANLFPRALAHHRWYRETFPEYPAERRAILPFVV